MTKHFCLLILSLLIATPAASKPLRIVASIKPIHSLLAGITQGVAEPQLLITSNQSPHNYSLRPSERRMLADADLFFWIGPTMESFMPRILASLQNKNKAISLIQTEGLKLLAMRQAHHDDDHDHNDHIKMDAHIWLNTHNVDTLIDAIADKLINFDPEHRQQYTANSKRLHDQVAQLRVGLQHSLIAVKTDFLTYHDGYQYFEDEFALNNAGFISSSELQPGARRISELKKQIKEKNIACVFYDAPAEPSVLKSLLSGSKAKSFMLDPVGIFIPPGKNLWFELINSLSKQFINCQQHL